MCVSIRSVGAVTAGGARIFGCPASHVGVYSVTQVLYNAALLFCWLWSDLAAAEPNTTRCQKPPLLAVPSRATSPTAHLGKCALRQVLASELTVWR